jgi:hypothetical protein
MLPDAARRYLDLEDWISSGVVFVAGDLRRRMTKSFDDTRGCAAKTFIYRALDNFYKNSLAFSTNKKRGSQLVSWDDLVGAGSLGHEDHKASAFVDRLDAFRKVQELHLHASTELVAYLDSHFFSQDFEGRVSVKGKQFESFSSEFRYLAKRYAVTIDDYRLAMRMYHELKHRERR